MITPLAWNNLAGTLRDQLAHLAQHVEKLEYLPCSGILKTAAAQQQQKAAGIHITAGMQRPQGAHPDRRLARVLRRTRRPGRLHPN